MERKIFVFADPKLIYWDQFTSVFEPLGWLRGHKKELLIRIKAFYRGVRNIKLAQFLVLLCR